MAKKKKEKLFEVDELIEKFDVLSRTYGEKPICDKLLGLSQIIDIFDNRLEKIFKIFNEHCGDVYSAKLHQFLRSKLLATKSPIIPEMISNYGVKASYIINEALDPRISVNALDRTLDKLIESLNLKIRDRVDINDKLFKKYYQAIQVSEKYLSVLEALGILGERNFSLYYSESIDRVASSLPLDKSIVASRPIFYLTEISSTNLSNIIKSMGKNFDALYGFSISAGLSIITYFSQGYYVNTLDKILEALEFSGSEIVSFYQKSQAGDSSIVYDILNKALIKFYSGNVSNVIDGIQKGIIQTDYAARLLLSVSFTTMSISGLNSLFDLIYAIVKKHGSASDIYVFRIVDKIVSEARPIIVRRFLINPATRKKILEIINMRASYPVIVALNRLINTFLPLDNAEDLSKEPIDVGGRAIERVYDEILPLLNKKTVLYFGLSH